MSMPDRVKVIKALEFTLAELGCDVDRAHDEKIMIEAVSDAIELLKAQEPHVIQFDEIDNFEVLWMEVRDVNVEVGLAPWVKTESGRWFSPLGCSKERPDMILATAREYGRICRCWTSRPTDAQREAIPWE